MSAPGVPETGLAAAREALQQRGYLRPAVPASPWRRVCGFLASVLVLAGALAAATFTAAGADPASLPALLVAVGPAALVLVGGGRVVGAWLGRGMLRAGGRPGAIAAALAWLGALCVVAILVALHLGRTEMGRGGVWTVTFGAALVAGALATRTRRALQRLLAHRGPAGGEGRANRLAWVLAAPAGVVLLLAGGGRTPPAAGEAAASFPAAHGRVAVIAVDGFAREELEAAANLAPGTNVREIAAWAWAPLAGPRGTLPAVFWTTVACGVEPARHGVVELEEAQLFGARSGLTLTPLARTAIVPFWQTLGAVRVVARPALARRTPTFWEMASRAGCPVSVGGWWGSWPVRRVLGEVASERAWLGGGVGEDAVTPALASEITAAWRGAGTAARAADVLAVVMADRAARTAGPHLAAISLPSPDLERRAQLNQPAIALASRVVPHLAALGDTVRTLRDGGFTVWVIGAPWSGGTPFVACSAVSAGALRAARPDELVATWLDGLGLPRPTGSPPPRRDLSGVAGRTVAAASYGPPPPPVAAPSVAGQAVQREVLRSLGYLR